MKMLDTSKTQEKPSTQSVSDEQDRTFKGAFKTFKLMKGDILQAIKQSGLVVVDSGDSESWSKLDCWAVRPDHDKNEAGNLDLSEEFGLLPVEQWEAKTVPSCPGGVILRNPFTKDGERRWIEHSLLDYPVREDFPSNLDRHWEYSETRSQLSWWPTPLDMVEQSERPKKKRKHGRNVIEDKNVSSAPIWKLRWITLGYHHDWDSKLYSEEKKTPFPANLGRLCEFIVGHLGFPDFASEAAIVNYYHLDSTLSPHQDVSEPYQEAPLISISFGQSAVFLIGGSMSEWPSTVILRSGDVFLMTGQSRLAFHGVPKVFVDPKWQLSSKTTEKLEQDDFLVDYLAKSRININVRQVLRPGETRLPVQYPHKKCQ